MQVLEKVENMVGDQEIPVHNAPSEEELVAPLSRMGSPLLVDSDFDGDDSMLSGFFGNRNRTFWTFQAFGWLGYCLVRVFHGMTVGFELSVYIQFILLSAVVGLSLSLVMRQLYRLVRDRQIILVLFTALFISAGMGLLFSTIETFIAPFFGWQPAQGFARFGNAMFDSTVLFAWSAIYFGYHFYEGYQQQQKQLLKATAMAHQAQLKMLRYQLNPHFLFNTLNAISTLVLEREVKDANQMLTKLSSFLRYTLVNQPTQRISLEQELYALGLYLDIERVRFQDRLQIDYDIDENAKSSLIPSLLLQPLIENAIKYAIAPSIDGGKLSVKASVNGRYLTITLKDNGPGLQDPENIKTKSGSGVGIANTKERLMQIYGSDHAFHVVNLSPSGLGITIEIPCEREHREP
ncbi:hypothetical protein GCM10017044_26570 [Kordiimonas sediminis]|uniref:Histidine kinase domain-containing protein n=1 Tax=Kordiimonas sediminis TaxID=1735581 RepID=A0A919EAD3_9PROT|nr:histidine kinase [Kordiimonas sediminis]GHF29943.1 hypothetical protein GCM10017044_26570 [Kordiimonas sediminis]